MSISMLQNVLAACFLILGSVAQAAEYEVAVRLDIQFAEHDGTKLLGDLYSPKGIDKAPVLVTVHGGGFQAGNRKFYTNWGIFMAFAFHRPFSSFLMSETLV